jgi:hypothetical protein
MNCMLEWKLEYRFFVFVFLRRDIPRLKGKSIPRTGIVPAEIERAKFLLFLRIFLQTDVWF